MNLRQTLIAAAIVPMMATAQMEVVPQKLDNPSNAPLPCFPVPSERQIKWNETEFYGFFHYGMNTYTGKEWGYGDEDENQFAPTKVPNPRQWLTVAKSAGMKGGIAVVKHHDGFCLWPTKTTEHNVTKSSNPNAQATNIPDSFGVAARELDMKYGFYISPWDRNSEKFAKDDYVTEVFLKQCEECAEYGDDQFEMWFDGANGGDGYYGGARENRSIDRDIYYDVFNLRPRIHRMAPDCVMWGVGGEARWIGNEAGWAGETNWATYDNGNGTDGNSGAPYGTEGSWRWNPGESDAKATTLGWFWHNGEGVLGVERLFQMYLETVGRNATWILNLPPDQSGELPKATVDRMEAFGKILKQRVTEHVDYAKSANITASATRKAGSNGASYTVANLIDDNKETYWAIDDNQKSATITLQWAEPQNVHLVQLMEPIRLGQRIKKFSIEYSENGTDWKKVNCTTTTVGYKRIIPLNGNTASYGNGFNVRAIRISILDSRACPLLSNLSIF